jgi:hypothetical protein
MRDDRVSHAEVSAARWRFKKQFPNEIDALLAESNGIAKGSNLSAFLPGRVKRWDVAKRKISIYTADDRRAVRAVELAGSVLGPELFAIGTNPEEACIRFEVGGAVGDPRYPHIPCSGNVSVGPGRSEWDPQTIASDGSFQKKLCINLDSKDGAVASLDVAVHELGHALGLGSHFHGFGEPRGGPAVDDKFWAALVRLYELPIGKEYVGLPPLP